MKPGTNHRGRLQRTLRLSMLGVLALLPPTQPAVSSQAQSAPRAGRNDGRSSPGAPRPAQRQRPSFYDFLLKQFNPDAVNYGAWMEERRQAFLNATVRNPYFAYSATMTIGLLVLGTLSGKKVIDHRRVLWATAEMMADLYNHDLYSRGVAREAIRKYNQHIEHCNRAIEAEEHGTTVSVTQEELERMRTQLQLVVAERDGFKHERDLAKSQVAEKERILADLSLRLQAQTRKSEANRGTRTGAADTSTTDQKLVKHINNLQEELYVERQQNRRLKGE